MCGRFTVSYSYEELLRYLDDEYELDDVNLNYQVPNYNVAPGQQILGMVHDGRNFRLGTFKWGYVPAYQNDSLKGFKLINTRSETVFDKGMFKDSIRKRRCIILADGFYEWDQMKNPFYIQMKDKKLFAIAGIYNIQYDDFGNKISSCSIMTTKANTLMGEIHERMPVILSKEDIKDWLNIKVQEKNDIETYLKEYSSDLMSKYRVSKQVNNVRNNTSDNIKEVFDNTLF